MPTISWLHLSDLHFGMKGQEWLWPNLRQEFYDDLSRISESAGPWDAVIFSGDLTQKGTSDEFHQLNNILLDLWKHLKSLGSEPTLICVPGNHDLVRPESYDPIVKAFRLWNKDKEIRDVFWNNPDNQYKNAIDAYFSNYTKWWKELPIPKPMNWVDGYLPGDFSTILAKGDYRVGIAGLNTSFIQITDENYEEKLELNEKQFCQVCSGDPVAWRNDLDLAFMVTHHPPSWLSQRSKKTYNSEVAPPGRFFAHICGHLHKPNCLSFSECGSEDRRIWQGPSIFGLRAFGKEKDRVERVHGYNACLIEFSESSGVVSVWPRKMAEKYSGKRRLGPDPGYELDENNALVIEFQGKKRGNLNGNEISNRTFIRETLEVIKADDTNVDTKIQLVYETSRLNNVPQLKLFNEPQHSVIRMEEQRLFRSALFNHRMVWLVSDWGQGKIGFISAALKDFKTSKEPVIYHLQCEELGGLNDLLSLFELQFGMQVQEFINQASVVDLPLVYFEKLPPEIFQDADDVARFTEIINALKDYDSKVHFIFDCRKEILGTNLVNVKLSALDIFETKTYISHHPDNSINISTPDVLEHLFMWSDGLPMYIDYLIKSLRVTPFKSLVSIEVETKYDELQQSEPVPKAFLHAVSTLAHSKNRYSRRSFRLLKILTILADGATLEKIKRFDSAEPFYHQNAIELESLGLLDIIQLMSLEPEIGHRKFNNEIDSLKVLRVPKQVRDYVKTIISDNEYSAIINRSAEVLFGEKWKEAKINISSVVLNRMAGNRPSGLGNEHVVIRQLLWEAVQNGDEAHIEKVLLLAISYLNKLNKIGRFKEVYYAAEELIHLMSPSHSLDKKAELLLIFGQSARMMGKREEAIDIIRGITDDPEINLTKEKRASANLDLALAYHSKGDSKDAIEAAMIVTKLEKKGTAYYDQARSIIIEENLQREEAMKELKQIEKKSWRLSRDTNASNIALTLARLSSALDEKIKYYDSVIDSSCSDYNRVRAIVNKTDELLKASRHNELRYKDKALLQASFSYCYSQNIENLFNKCTRVIWELLSKANRYDQVLKLFRYSSLVWRLRGEQETEKKYLEIISSFSEDFLASAQETDVCYYKMRLSS